MLLTLIMLGSTLGFLLHNFNPAKIFMGDTGSLFLGFTISVIALLGFKAATVTSLIVPLLILAIPIFDTALAILRRLLKGEGIMSPDKQHFLQWILFPPTVLTQLGQYLPFQELCTHPLLPPQPWYLRYP